MHGKESLKALTEWCQSNEIPMSALVLCQLAWEEATERAAVIAEYHSPTRYRGGYAEGLIEGNPMADIAAEIRG